MFSERYLDQLVDELQIRPLLGPGLEHGRQYPTVACVNCWRDVLPTDASFDRIAAHRRGFCVYADEQFVIHRRHFVDGHVVGAVCGDIYTHAAVRELAPGS